MSAGDPSADFPGKNLIDQIQNGCPGMKIFGLGGPLMQQTGLEPIADYRELAVMGFFEIIPKLFFFRRLMARTVSLIAERRPKAVILLDYPGFNLRLAARIKPLGIPIIYYISPQVWAWGKGRIPDIRKLVDLMLVVYPFEEAFYRNHGVPVTFTGHPLVDRYRNIPDRIACRGALGYADDDIVIALLPGSRPQEIKRMLPVMVDAAGLIRGKIDRARFIVAAVDNFDAARYRAVSAGPGIVVCEGRTPEILAAADLVITSSGTATIEAAYFGVPMVVIYKTGFFTFQLARRLVALDYISIVNIVAGRKVVPELIQSEATAGSIAAQALELLRDRSRYAAMVQDLQQVRAALGDGATGQRAFAAIRDKVALC